MPMDVVILELLRERDAGGPGEELPPGEYKVVMKAADQELVEQVTVASAADTVLKVILKGDRFAIER